MDIGEKARMVAGPVLKALDSPMLRISAPGAREAIGELVALVAEVAHEVGVLRVRANQHAVEIRRLRIGQHTLGEGGGGE